MTDTLRLLNLSVTRKNKYIKDSKREMKQRVLTGKKIKRTVEEKELIIREHEAVKTFDEESLRGDYKLIYPNDDRQK
jgi:tubulin polyglutamylase TTLL6/13